MKTKFRNYDEQKFVEVFGHEGPYVEYDIKGDIITIENGTKVKFSITPEPIPGYEVLKKWIYEYQVEGETPVRFETMDNFGNYYTVYKVIQPLISRGKVTRSGIAMDAATKAKLKEELARYRASKGQLTKKETDQMGGPVKTSKK